LLDYLMMSFNFGFAFNLRILWKMRFHVNFEIWFEKCLFVADIAEV
jgi:hypothetical protein